MDTEQLIEALCQPPSYPHQVDVITTIETHISVVFLTGPYAYKLKKPVDFGFLDFTRLSSRKYFCEQELRLNHRTAPDLYLQVVPLYLGADNRITFEAGQSGHQPPQPVEYLLKMHQFDPNSVLGRYLKEHELTVRQEQTLAEEIAHLHLHAKTVSEHSHLGEPDTQLQPMLDNFPTLLDLCSGGSLSRLEALQDWTYRRFSKLKPLLIERKHNGFVRECHGDLHIDNIALIKGRPTLFDGIEFNDEFRWIDVISDLAFLLIDLEFRGRLALKRRILSHYLSLTGDYNALELLSFYCVYRTLVRAKISALRLTQLDQKTPEYQHYKAITQQYIDQAEATFAQPDPRLILLQGVSGSGKSHFASELLGLLDAVIVSSDVERKRLYGITAHTRVPEEEKPLLYSADMSRRTYQTLLGLAERILRRGHSVIVDATFLKAEHRAPFYKLAETLNVKANLFALQISEEMAAQAIRERMTLDNSPSDADVAVMKQQIERLQRPGPEEPHLTLNAELLRRHFPKQTIQEFLSLPIED